MVSIMSNGLLVWLILSLIPSSFRIFSFEIIGAIGLLAGLLCNLHYSMKEQLRKIDGLRRVHKEIDSAIYQVLQEDLRSFKAQQWNVIYYLMLVFGALFALGQYAKQSNNPQSWAWILFTCTLASFCYGVYLILELQYNIRNTRVRMTNTEIYKIQIPEISLKDQIKRDRRFWRDKRIAIGFIITSFIGLAIVSIQLLPCF